MTSQAAAEALWTIAELPQRLLSRLILSEPSDPVVDSSFKLGTAAQTSIGLAGLAAAYLHELRTGVEQTVSVNARHAVLEFKSESYYTVNGQLKGSTNIFDELAGVYKTKDDNYVRIHTNFPHHKQGILDILGCAPTKDAVSKALLNWNSFEFEEETALQGMVATVLRTYEQWAAHPQGMALKGVPPVTITKVGDAPKKNLSGMGKYPLEGVRVLDLTRVLAGPVCGRTLATYGADVLLITSPSLPDLPDLDIDTSRGKRTTQLDLNQAPDRLALMSLVKEADVFLQAYRPSGLDKKGFDIEEVVKYRPGIVYASLRAYGWDGPWKDRRGFDSLVQTATGFNIDEAEAYTVFRGETKSRDVQPPPKALPLQAIDHAAGYLLAFGINAALCKTITEGGSWEVRVSLAAVGSWIRSLGRLSPEAAFDTSVPKLPPRVLPQDPEVASLTIELQQAKGDREEGYIGGKMTAIRHAAELTTVKEGEAPMRLDAHEPRWLPII